MTALGGFGAERRVAVAVSGGADSMALALLLAGWGRPTAMIVDHGLRDGSAAEARLVAGRLEALGIMARVLPRLHLPPGGAMAARAREGRYAALSEACRAAGLVDLLVGHHAQDQAETVLIRRKAGSGSAGLAGMAVVTNARSVRIVRPLLTIDPARLRATLREAGVAWLDDPGNDDPATTRGGVRRMLRAAHGSYSGQVVSEARQSGHERCIREAEWAAELACFATWLPGGVVSVASPTLSAGALSALLWTVSGALPPPAPAAVARLVRLRPATLHSAAIVEHAGGWLIGREAAAQASPVAAEAGVVWDGRFRLHATVPGGTLGPLGADAARVRRWSALPAALLRTLPAIRRDDALFAVPHLSYPSAMTCRAVPIAFSPIRPAAPTPFMAA